MLRHKLTARQVATARPGAYGDGAGLRLIVSGSGARRWVFRFQLAGRSREKALEARRQVKAGVRDMGKPELQTELECNRKWNGGCGIVIQ